LVEKGRQLFKNKNISACILSTAVFGTPETDCFPLQEAYQRRTKYRLQSGES